LGNTGNWQDKQTIDDIVRQAKNDWDAADARGDQAAKDAAHSLAEDARRVAAAMGHETYNNDADDSNYANNYSPGESTGRPPAWMDWDNDGSLDINKDDGHKYDANNNRIDAVDSNGYRVGGWRAEPNAWDFKGQNNGGFEPDRGSSGGGGSPSYSSPSYYSPPPQPPAAPSAPPIPRAAPAFTKETQKELVKYEYLYGIKDLRITGNEFATKSVYVSKPIQIDGNVMQVSLDAVEEHPVFSSISGEATERQTSVEYYISYLENPITDDWHPILPEGETEIPCELLIFDTARTAKLRFPALTYSDPEPKVYKDGIEYADWAFTGGGTKVQLTTEIAVGSIYTIRYTPNAEIVNPWSLDIYQQGLKTAKQVDRFPEGANHNRTLSLSKYPYVDYEKINKDPLFNPNTTAYRPMTVSLANGSIAGKDRKILKEVVQYTGSTVDAAMLNITDYKTKEWKVPKPYTLDKTSPYTMFEYWHEGKKLYFSETFNKSDVLTNQDFNHGNAEVVVEYDYLVAFFRVKIIMRRTGPGINSVSPVVHQYSLKFKTMK
jgi:hypothetical protein